MELAQSVHGASRNMHGACVEGERWVHGTFKEWARSVQRLCMKGSYRGPAVFFPLLIHERLIENTIKLNLLPKKGKINKIAEKYGKNTEIQQK